MNKTLCVRIVCQAGLMAALASCGGGNAPTDGMGRLDGMNYDGSSTLDSTAMDVPPGIDVVMNDLVTSDLGGDVPCLPLTLGGSTEEVYVDKGVARTGTGTAQCPFATIVEATSLAAPAASVTRRTIHVRGNTSAPDYNETQAILLAPRVTLTSNYDAASPGGVATVRINARGDCATLAGASVFCAVGMDNDARLELVTVRVTTGPTTGNGVLTTATLPTGTSSAPTIVDVAAENAQEAGIRVLGSAVIGPRVTSTGNQNGVNVGRATGLPQSTLTVHDVLTSPGMPSNSFSDNRGNGMSIFGDTVATIEGASITNNGGQGVVVGTPYTATTTVSHHFTNVHIDNNANNGLRVVAGEVRVMVGSFVNTFSNNRNGYGIQATTGDAVGDCRVILDPSMTGSTYAIAHQASSNSMGGILLNRATPPATAPHQIASLEARQNGTAANLGAGIYVQVVGANQSSLVLRGSTLLQNRGQGLRFQLAPTNSLDIGTATSGGYNTFGDATAANRNGKSGICYENGGNRSVAGQMAELDHWSQACPLPLTMATFQASAGGGGCGSNATYIEITYTGTTRPFGAVAMCF